MGIEPTQSAWKAEVLPLNYTRVIRWRGKDSNLRRRKPSDLQSDPFGRSGTPPLWEAILPNSFPVVNHRQPFARAVPLKRH